jgi:hypothetical protein
MMDMTMEPLNTLYLCHSMQSSGLLELYPRSRYLRTVGALSENLVEARGLLQKAIRLLEET